MQQVPQGGALVLVVAMLVLGVLAPFQITLCLQADGTVGLEPGTRHGCRETLSGSCQSSSRQDEAEDPFRSHVGAANLGTSATDLGSPACTDLLLGRDLARRGASPEPRALAGHESAAGSLPRTGIDSAGRHASALGAGAASRLGGEPLLIATTHLLL